MCCDYSRRRETRIVPNNFNTIVKILLELLIQGSPFSLRCKQCGGKNSHTKENYLAATSLQCICAHRSTHIIPETRTRILGFYQGFSSRVRSFSFITEIEKESQRRHAKEEIEREERLTMATDDEGERLAAARQAAELGRCERGMQWRSCPSCRLTLPSLPQP